MSTVTLTEIIETSDGGEPADTADIEQAYVVEEVKVDEKGEETDVETDDGDVQNLNEGVKKKKKKLRRELSISQKQRGDDTSGLPQGYSSSEETENVSKFKRKENTTATIRRRIVKKSTDKEEVKERSRRGKSEPKELKEDDAGSAKAKKTWWPFSRSRSDHRQVQTDGEARSKSRKSDESSDEFWKSGSFRRPKSKKAQAKSVEDVPKSIVGTALKSTVDTATIVQPVKPSVSSLVTKEILTDEITVEIINEAPVQILGRPSWKQFKQENATACRLICLSRNRCISLFVAFSIYLGLGALAIRFIEGTFENFYKCGVKRVKRDFIDSLWERRYGNEDEWKSLARRTLLNFENELQTAFDAGMKSYSGQQSWSFINSYMYCLNVVTTIGRC